MILSKHSPWSGCDPQARSDGNKSDNGTECRQIWWYGVLYVFLSDTFNLYLRRRIFKFANPQDYAKNSSFEDAFFVFNIALWLDDPSPVEIKVDLSIGGERARAIKVCGFEEHKRISRGERVVSSKTCDVKGEKAPPTNTPGREAGAIIRGYRLELTLL